MHKECLHLDIEDIGQTNIGYSFGLANNLTGLVTVQNEFAFQSCHPPYKLNLIIKSPYMCSCFAQGLCCCFSCCCQSCSQSLHRLFGKEKMAKISYLFLVIIFTVPAIAILFFINKWDGFRSHFTWMSCPSSSGGQFECIGPSTIFRISLSFLCLFGLMLIVMLFRSRISMVVNQGLFCVKYLLVLGLFIAFLFVTNTTFDQYSEASKYISIAFMAIQAIILVDLFYLAGIKLVKRYDNGESCCGFVLILLTLVFETCAIGLNVLGYIYFGASDNCGNSLWANIITSIILGLLPIFQFCNFNKQNSLLTTSLVGMYIAYLSFICQFSYGKSCTDRMTVNSIAADIIVSTFLFLLTMYGSIMGGSGQVKIGQNGDVNKAMGVAPTDDVNVGSNQMVDKKYEEHKGEAKSQAKVQNAVEDEQSEAVNLAKYTESWGWVKWHFYMCLASIYVSMLATNWTSASLTTGDLMSNGFGFWVRISMSWFTALVYLWTLIAPKIFPERDFTVV